MMRGPSVHNSAARTGKPRIDPPDHQSVGGELQQIGVSHRIQHKRRRPVGLVVDDPAPPCPGAPAGRSGR